MNGRYPSINNRESSSHIPHDRKDVAALYPVYPEFFLSFKNAFVTSSRRLQTSSQVWTHDYVDPLSGAPPTTSVTGIRATKILIRPYPVPCSDPGSGSPCAGAVRSSDSQKAHQLPFSGRSPSMTDQHRAHHRCRPRCHGDVRHLPSS